MNSKVESVQYSAALAITGAIRLFHERCVITCAHTHTCAKAFRGVISHVHKSNFYYTFLLQNCLFLICARSHVTIKQTDVVDY